jgi:Ca2+-binding RTX toxin-like protein
MFEPLENRRLLSVSLSEGILTVEGTAETDRIAVRREGEYLYVNLNGAVTRYANSAVRSIRAFGLGGNDAIAVIETTKPATLDGGAGNDSLRGAAGNDLLNGGDGNDALSGGPGADVFNGGGGIDTAIYEERTAGLRISLDGVANDGQLDEHDNVKPDVENVVGGRGNDAIVGSEASNRLDGRGGNDSIGGGAGNDQLLGAGGNDLLNGGAGNDRLDGGEGTDALNGSDGNDGLVGGPGADVFNGGGGIDLANYEGRPDNLVITLDGIPNDGFQGSAERPAEHDNVRGDVENVAGGRGNDRITGNGLANALFGGLGNDTLYGGGGNDTLTGGPGNDKLYGQDGNDTLLGRDEFADLLDGGGGEDRASRNDSDTLVSIESVIT